MSIESSHKPGSNYPENPDRRRALLTLVGAGALMTALHKNDLSRGVNYLKRGLDSTSEALDLEFESFPEKADIVEGTYIVHLNHDITQPRVNFRLAPSRESASVVPKLIESIGLKKFPETIKDLDIIVKNPIIVEGKSPFDETKTSPWMMLPNTKFTIPSGMIRKAHLYINLDPVAMKGYVDMSKDPSERTTYIKGQGLYTQKNALTSISFATPSTK